MTDHYEDMRTIRDDVKMLIGNVSSIQAVNEMQLVELKAMKEGFQDYKKGHSEKHQKIDGNISELAKAQVRQEERHAFTWKMILGIGTALGLFAFIYEAWLK